MTKAESAASRTQKTHFADDETLAHIAALELEAADLRSCIKDLRERLAKAEASCKKSKMFAMFIDQKFWHAHHVDLVWRHDGKDIQEEADWLKDLYYVFTRALAHPKGEDHGL